MDSTPSIIGTGKQVTVSESHPVNRDNGSYESGGPFFTSRVSYFANPGHVRNAYNFGQGKYYTGPVLCNLPTSANMDAVGFTNKNLNYGSENSSKLSKDGATAVSLSSPTNPATNLGTTLAEMHREGLPSLPGVQTWRNRTQLLKAAGSEYLNKEFGWQPLVDEINPVVNAARHSKLVMEQYHSGEGRNTHRSFKFPLQHSAGFADMGEQAPAFLDLSGYYAFPSKSRRVVSRVSETKRWFEGAFTYALPSSTSSWGKMLGIGSEADKLFGISLSPDILWELTPWSWAVDWFSNAGDVVNNVTNFGLAGLVMRYGFMMEESIEKITVENGPCAFHTNNGKGGEGPPTFSTPCSSGIECVTKRRGIANPFGFGIGWEGLSPTQLAITAALGITRWL
jgi:hypothetical protein